MNILYITHCDPRETGYGSAQRSHYLWEALKKIGMVYTVYNVGPNVNPVCDEVERIMTASFAPRGYFRIRMFALINHLLAPLVWPFRNKRTIQNEMPWEAVSFDCVVVRYLGAVALTNAWKFGRVFVDIDDLPIESYNTIRKKKLLPPFGWLGSLIVGWWQRYLLRKCEGAWIASPEQVKDVAPYCPCTPLLNLPMPVPEGYRINGAQERQLMTVGLMSYEPNFEGVDWFVHKVWPEIHSHYPDLAYLICGGGVPDNYMYEWSAIPGVQVCGFVEDLDSFYEKSLAVVAPILSGAGTCIKVQEACVRGRKVFATIFALRGLSHEDSYGLGIVTITSSAEMLTDLKRYIQMDVEERANVQIAIANYARRINSYDVFAKTVRMKLISQNDYE